jgi:hypothetical protein
MNQDGSQNITVTVTGADWRGQYEALRDRDVEIDIRPRRKRRSLDANAYAWVLIDKIAEAMRIGRTEVYRNAIRDIGGVSTTICVTDGALERLRSGWEAHGIGWQTETFPSKVKGCTNVTLYYGSSTYDSAQMGALIDHLIQDAEGLGVETITPEEKKRLLAAMK